MSFDNSVYPNRKDRRKNYRGAKGFCRSCRNHGSCTYCSDGRQHFDKKRRVAADEQIKEAKRASGGTPEEGES